MKFLNNLSFCGVLLGNPALTEKCIIDISLFRVYNRYYVVEIYLLFIINDETQIIVNKIKATKKRHLVSSFFFVAEKDLTSYWFTNKTNGILIEPIRRYLKSRNKIIKRLKVILNIK